MNRDNSGNSGNRGKRNFELLVNMAELTALFEKTGSVATFLQDVVELVAVHMSSDVCSIYLFDNNTEMLVLRATKGLNKNSIGLVTLKVGEGITGKAFEETRPIREGRANQNPFFKPIPGIEEEKYQAFLAVPIRRGVTKIGVLTLQHKKANFFTTQDTRALRAIGSQLAAAIENAEMLMELYEEQVVEDVKEIPQELPGTATGKGIALGKAIVLRKQSRNVEGLVTFAKKITATRDKFNTIDELERFAHSLKHTKLQLEELQEIIDSKVTEMADLIFSSHLLMLRDEKFSGAMQSYIEDGYFAEQAIAEVIRYYVDLFSKQENSRVQEKVQDVLDLGHRLIRNLAAVSTIKQDFSGYIVVAADIFPSEVVKYAAQQARGLILKGGTATAHVGLLARSLGLPALFIQETDVLQIPDDTFLILDADHERLHINPQDALKEHYKSVLASNAVVQNVSLPEKCLTIDSKHIQVMANINLVQDVTTARGQNAEGIGLYRSEFPFIIRNDFPSEEDQVTIYQKIFDEMKEKEVTMRTLDIGGDKVLNIDDISEPNPFLGYRGIRFSLGNEEIFQDQIKAMLRAAYDHRGEFKIMFPMVGSLEEFVAAKDIVYKSMEDLHKEKMEFNANPRIGAMIELPAAVEIVEELSEISDFLSIGTNDLIMYILAVDRTNERVGSLYRSYHPAVLRTLRRITEGVGSKIDMLSVCGEAANDPVMLPFFIGLGIKKISVDPKAIPTVKSNITKLSVERSQVHSETMLSFANIKDIEEYIKH